MKNFNQIRLEIERLESFKRALNNREQKQLDALKLYLESAIIQIEKSGKVRTRSTYGKSQNRSTGPRTVRNAYGHAVGTAGAAIDTIVSNPDLNERYSKAEIAAICNTKVSKVNSHFRNELVKKYGFDFVVNASGKVKVIYPVK